MNALPHVLNTTHLALADLHAAKLDGQLIAIGEGFRLTDVPEQELDRASSLASLAAFPLVLCEESAAWVWLGGLEPLVHRCCVRPRRQRRPQSTPRRLVRELVLEHHQTVARGGVMLTTPLRTAFDLARARRPTATAALRLLINSGHVNDHQLKDMVVKRNRLPGRWYALEQLELIAPSRC